MRIVRISLFATSIALLTNGTVYADYLTAVKPLPGFICMNLAISHDQAVDRSFSVPVFASPSLNTPKIGIASIGPFIKYPFRPGQPFQEILTLGGKIGWIETKWLEPWSSPTNPKATCSPWIMSNGRPGPKINSNR